MSITRQLLRQYMGRQVGDLTSLTATANGSTTTFVDTTSLVSAVETAKGRDIIFTSTPNLGIIRRITAADMTTGTLTFAAVTSTVAGNTAELYNFRGKGWRVEEYHDAINRAIASAFRPYYQPFNAVIAAVFDDATGDLTVPAGITHVEDLEFEDPNGIWQTVPQAGGRGQSGWWADQYANTINVRDWRFTSLMDGQNLRLIGWTRPTLMTAETSVTYIDQEWLISKASSLLCLSALDRDRENYNRGMVFQQEADRNEGALRTRMSGKVRPLGYTQ